MILKKMMVCIAAVCCCGGVLGVGETLVPVFPPAGKISVLPGTAPEQVEFPAVPPKKDYGVALRFDARIVTPTLSGWNHFLGITANGNALTSSKANGNRRLLGRGESFDSTSATERTVPWWISAVNGMG